MICRILNAVALSLAIIPGVCHAAPRLVIDGQEIDLGIVEPSREITASIKVQNSGDEPLELRGTKVSCACTQVKLPKSPLAPGEVAEIVLSVKTPPSGSGVAGTVLLESNDPIAPQTPLRFKGRFKAWYELSANIVDICVDGTQTIYESGVLIRLAKDGPQKILSAASKSSRIAATVEATGERSYLVRLKVDTDGLRGQWESAVEFPTNTAGQTIHLPIHVMALSEMQVEPEEIMVMPGVIPTTPRMIVVRFRPGADVEGLSVTSDIPAVVASVSKGKPNGVWKVSLTGLSGSPTLDGHVIKLLARFGGGKSATIEVPIRLVR